PLRFRERSNSSDHSDTHSGRNTRGRVASSENLPLSDKYLSIGRASVSLVYRPLILSYQRSLTTRGVQLGTQQPMYCSTIYYPKILRSTLTIDIGFQSKGK